MSPTPPGNGGGLRVAFFGLLGSGNLGNDGSFEAVLNHLRDRRPDIHVSCVCIGPDEIARRYGVATRPMQWHRPSPGRRWRNAALKPVGKVVDAFRTFGWVRAADVVVVPGMGVLEASLPLRPWGVPYALVLVCLAGRLTGTRVALLNVGATAIEGQPVTRNLIGLAARLARYRSYRDTLSKDAVRRLGVDVTGDGVYPDLAYALPAPLGGQPCQRTVGVGVMAYYGTQRDRDRASDIHAGYRAGILWFVRWLVDNGYRVRLFTGDPADEEVASAIVAQIRARRSVSADIVVEPTRHLTELMERMSQVGVVVASRYHNVLSALKLGIPTVSVSYAEKNDALMAEAGLAGYCQPIRELDPARLVQQFLELTSRHDQLREQLLAKAVANAALLDEQFAALSSTLFR